MSFEFYVDVRVIESADTVDLSLPTIRNQIYAVLHGTFRALALVDKSPYAIALVASPKLKAKQADFEKKYGKSPRFDFDIFLELNSMLAFLQYRVHTMLPKD